MLKAFLRSGASELDAHDVQRLNKLDDIILRKSIEDLYDEGRQKPSLSAMEISQPILGLSSNFEELLPTEDMWQDLDAFDFDAGPLYPLPDPTMMEMPLAGEEDIFAPTPLSAMHQSRKADDKVIWTSETSAHLQRAINLLPACNRCRHRRVKCDRQLPACLYCTKSQNPCLYYDYVLSEDIPRQ